MSGTVHRVLIAVQSTRHRETIESALAYLGACKAVDDGWLCLRLIEEGGWDLLVVCSNLANLRGGNVVRSLRSDHRYAGLPIILIADSRDLESKQFERGHRFAVLRDDPLETAKLVYVAMKLLAAEEERHWRALPDAPRAFMTTSKRLFEILVRQYGRLTAEDVALVDGAAKALVESVADGMTARLLETMDAHDDYTFVHNLRVAAMLVAFGFALKVSEGEAQLLASAGLLHDIGKLAIPPAVLVKPAALDDREWEIMRRHPEKGAAVLKGVEGIPREVIAVAERHHERLDGTGYPHGLKGSQIDDLSLIAAVADVYSALTDRRSYKRALDNAEAFKILRGMAGSHLEPGFVERFIAVFDS